MINRDKIYPKQPSEASEAVLNRNWAGDIMGSAKEVVRKLLKEIPDESTFEDCCVWVLMAQSVPH